jgi:REP element-mobilizing transposase RayT
LVTLLQNNYHKQIIIEGLSNRVNKKKVTVFGFVLMPNYMHLIWQLHDNIIKEHFQRDFLKFTARSILQFMRMHEDPLLESLKVSTPDRQYQVWERNSLSIDIYSEKILLQKLNYIHNNPVHPKWRLSDFSENYKYSSASFYETGISEFDWLSHFRG